MLAKFLLQISHELRGRFRQGNRELAGTGTFDPDQLNRVRDLLSKGRIDEAEALCHGWLARDADNPVAQLAAGEVALERNDRAKAEQRFRRALSRRPELADALFGLGVVYYETSRPHDALSPFSAAVRLQPHNARIQNAYGLALLATGSKTMAYRRFKTASELAPNDPYVWNNLGITSKYRQNISGALQCFLRALRLNPAFTTAYSNAGLAYREIGDAERALEYATRAVELSPENPGHRINQGVVYKDLARLEEAEASFRAALRVGGDDARALHGLGTLAFARDDRPSARSFFTKALAADPEYAEAHALLGEVELSEGDFANGWKHYEYRLKADESPARQFSYPLWDGTPQPDHTLLVFAEQGIGDLIMFAGALTDIRPLCRRVLLACPARAETLFRRSFPWLEVMAVDGTELPESVAQQIDLQLPIASLMLHFRKSWSSFPKHTGYLTPDPDRTGAWKRRLDSSPERINVGIAWKGGFLRTGSQFRSIPLERFLPVFNVSGTRFFSLQHFDVSSEVDEFQRKAGIDLHHDPAIAIDIEELIALIAALDLVVTACSTVAHLVGAIGIPGIVLAPQAASWRYLRQGELLPWYPTLRVLRQKKSGYWEDVIQEAASALHETTASRPVGP